MRQEKIVLGSIILCLFLLFFPENFKIKMEFWSETLDLNYTSAVPQFDIEDDADENSALDNP